MFEVYLPAFLLAIVATLVGVGIFGAATLFGKKRPSFEKNLPYESGSNTTGARHIRLSVKFYLTAILFVVFDIEAVFMYPWAAEFRNLGWIGLFEMLTFISILGITLLYAWKKGALEWES